ncbi:MAG: FAD-binding protein, partial [Bacillota bacterium]|nr:FAD-binding protein [Bacillota bacterium]
LATGGAGKVFAHNVFPAGSTGDAFTLAYEAGAELVNIEFIQIGIASTKTKLNCSGSAMRALPRIINDQGEEFLAKYFSDDLSINEIYDYVFQKGASWPVTYEHKTHVIDIAVYKEIAKGSKVYLDYSTNPNGFSFVNLSPQWQERYRSEMTLDLGQDAREASPLNRLKEINSATIEWLKEHGVDVESGDMVQIATCIQHFQGGVKIGEQAETKVAGLFAVGECAGGQHGANRPGGNALLDSQVFGKIAANAALKRCENIEATTIELAVLEQYCCQLQELKTIKNGTEAWNVRRELQDIMNKNASIVRTESGLSGGLKKVKELQQLAIKADKHGLAYALETKNMLLIAEMILLAASCRNESRGPHLRFNQYADNVPVGRKDPDWQKYIVLRKGSNGIELSEQVPQGLPERG